MKTIIKPRSSLTPRRFCGAGVVLLLIILAAGCGIPDYAYLEPPHTVSMFADTVSFFSNATDNNPDIFWGYQVYGKFYNHGSYTEGLIYTESKQVTSFSKLTSLDFFRLVKPDSTGNYADPEPVINLTEVEKGQSLRFTLDFSGDRYPSTEGFNTVISYGSKEIKVARNVLTEGAAAGDRELKSFQRDKLDPDDSDLKNLSLPAGEESMNFIYLSLFVLSFGRESEGYVAVYSEPVYLGFVELPVDDNKAW